MEDARYSQWVTVSPATAAFEQFMMTVVHGLGRLDCQLIHDDGKYSALAESEQHTVTEAIRMTDRFTLSYLWVLGAYELVRTMSQRARERPTSIGSLGPKLAELKRSFERIRIPLAKMEPAKAHEKTDSSIAFPALHRKLGISWQLAHDTYISRRELSDSLLHFLEALRAQDPHFPENQSKKANKAVDPTPGTAPRDSGGSSEG